MTRIIYMGTPSLALPPLRALIEESHEIVTIVTPPDRPAGRSRQPQPSPVKTFATTHHLPIWQPVSLRTPEASERIRELRPDIIIVTAYGAILPPAILSLPPHGCLNIHLSLLPQYRGAAPVAATILAGDNQTGVTIMRMDEGLDTGPIVAQRALPLSGKERRGELAMRLAESGADLLSATLPAWLSGEIQPRPQDEAEATYSPPLRKADGEVDWTNPARYIERKIRAFDPWPGVYTFLHSRRLRLWKAAAVDREATISPGTVTLQQGQIMVATGGGWLHLEEIQLAGKRRLAAPAFLRGQRDLDGARLGR